MKKKRVMSFGTFDIIHPGHIAFLSAAAKCGNELFVVVSRDTRRKKISGDLPVHTQTERISVLNALKPVTRAIAGSDKDILKAIKRYTPDVIVLGHDQVYGIEMLDKWIARQENPPKIVRLPAFRRGRFSTTRIKKVLCQSST